MIEKGRPRPGLGTNADAEAWAEHYRLLRYDLRMTAEQVAFIDWGGDADAARWHGAVYERTFPLIDVARMLGRVPASD